jgi:hypothetical protein
LLFFSLVGREGEARSRELQLMFTFGAEHHESGKRPICILHTRGQVDRMNHYGLLECDAAP